MVRRKTKKQLGNKPGSHSFIRPQGAPRGLLRQYILHRIAERPYHGYDILQEIESKTEGSWRPGAGSIYPILKELLAKGHIKADSPKKGWTSQRVYRITPNGLRFLQQSSDMFMKAGQNWGAMRRIIIELIEPRQVPSMLGHMSAGQFGFVREILDSKKNKIPRGEVESLLKEYASNLQRQLEWTNRTLKKL